MKLNNLNTFTFTSVKLSQEKHNKKRSKYSKFGQHNTKTDVAGPCYTSGATELTRFLVSSFYSIFSFLCRVSFCHICLVCSSSIYDF